MTLWKGDLILLNKISKKVNKAILLGHKDTDEGLLPIKIKAVKEDIYCRIVAPLKGIYVGDIKVIIFESKDKAT